MFTMSLLIGVGTYAYFNAHSSAASQFTAGEIKIEANRDSSDPVDGPMFYTTADDGKVLTGPNAGMLGKYPDGFLKPGFESKPKTLVITNKGTITPYLTKISAQYILGDLLLADVLEVDVYRSIDAFTPPVLLYTGTLNALLSGPQNLLQKIDVPGLGTQETLIFKVRFPETNEAQNAYQGKELKVKFLVHAETN